MLGVILYRALLRSPASYKKYKFKGCLYKKFVLGQQFREPKAYAEKACQTKFNLVSVSVCIDTQLYCTAAIGGVA